MRILAIDPGRDKCGLVVADEQTILGRAVVAAPELARVLRQWGIQYRIEKVVLGDRTGQKAVRTHVTAQLPGVPISIVREANTTLLARRWYFTDHPPRGWRRFLPVSMQVPPEPYDDYAAQVILKRFNERQDDHD
jgi:RNase H-fold protein (predicted Holliday junction resolvase)